jgi:hypothetical protein
MIQHDLQQMYIFGLLQSVFSTHGDGEVPVIGKLPYVKSPKVTVVGP